MKSAIEDVRFYDVWDMEIPALLPRSILYNLPPVGVGTEDVESLSGYISRLAYEHSLTPSVLLRNSTPDLSELPKSIMQNGLLALFGESINGHCTNTGAVTEILQNATTRTDICCTSLLSWKGAVSKRYLFKRYLAWCPVCFNEQVENTGIVYQKLIWSFYSVNVCHTHRIQLVESCPFCLKKLKVLSNKSRPGYCSECRKWLGCSLTNSDDLKIFKNQDEKKREVWKVNVFGDMLTKLPLLLINNQNEFIKNLTYFINTFSGGSINDFAYKTEIWHVKIRNLLKGEALPTTETLLKLSLSLNILPTELFEKRDDLVVDHTPLESPKKLICEQEIKSFLNSCLEDYPPPSGYEVARRMVCSNSFLPRNFPDEYKKIVKKYREHVKKSTQPDNEIEMVLIKALNEKSPPSLQSVFRSVGCRNGGFRYYKRFPELCAKIAARYKKIHLKKFDIKKGEKMIKIFLEENPPPSMAEVSRRIGCARRNIKKNFPELAATINQRYKTYSLNFRGQNIQQLKEEVKKALTKLQMEKSIISISRVKKLMPRSWSQVNFKKAYLAVTEEMKLMVEK